jgi:dCMP deaminase
VTTQVLLYLPVLHDGYEQFLARHADADEVLLLGTSFRDEFKALRKDIRALAPERAAAYLRTTLTAPVRVVERDDLLAAITADVLVAPDEDVIRDLIAAHDLDDGRQVVLERTFLRWDRPWSAAQRPPGYDGVVSDAAEVRALLDVATDEAQRSSDWWRQVGAIAVRRGAVIAQAHNEHRPTEYAPYVHGDPRDNFSRGVRSDLSTALHAEAGLIAACARDGIALAGCDLYVTTFPCPSCARLVAEAGFATCYFAGGYSSLDGEEVLRAAGVELCWVDLAEDADDVTTAASSAGA